MIDAISLSENKPILRVIGGLIPSTLPYMNLLKKRAKSRKVKVEFYPNISREELVKIATSSKVFAHACRGEHFGIAVVEGMASGCPVVVHKSGGAYEDITDYGKYGLVYSSVEELVECIDKLMSDLKVWTYYHDLSLRRNKEYSEDAFRNKFLKVIKRVGW